MILYVKNGRYDLGLCLSCNSKWEILPFPWVREAVMHWNLEKNSVLTKTWSHEERLSTQQVCCHQPDHSKRPSPGVSLKKYVFTPIKWFLLFVASGQKIRSVKDCLNEQGKCSGFLQSSLSKDKIHSWEKLSPSFLSQEFLNFWWAKAEESITGNESRTVDAETMNMWNSLTGLSLLILKNLPYFEQETGLFTVSYHSSANKTEQCFYLVMPHTWNKNCYPFASPFSQMLSSK